MSQVKRFFLDVNQLMNDDDGDDKYDVVFVRWSPLLYGSQLHCFMVNTHQVFAFDR